MALIDFQEALLPIGNSLNSCDPVWERRHVFYAYFEILIPIGSARSAPVRKSNASSVAVALPVGN